MMLYQTVQILYWLALATWFGGVLFVAISAQVVFRTVREQNPVLPGVLSVNMEGQHATLLAGSIVANILSRLMQVAMICSAVMLLAMLMQIFLIDRTGPNDRAAMIRAVLFFAAVGVMLFDYLVLRPRIIGSRNQYIEHADEPDIANPAKDQFDRDHALSVRLLMIVLALLLLLIAYSSNIAPKKDQKTLEARSALYAQAAL